MHRLDRPRDKLQQLLLGRCGRCPRPRLSVALGSVPDQAQQPPRLGLRVLGSHDGAHHRNAVQWLLGRAAAEQHLRDVGGVDAPDAHGGDTAVAPFGEDGQGVPEPLWPDDVLGVCFAACNSQHFHLHVFMH